MRKLFMLAKNTLYFYAIFMPTYRLPRIKEVLTIPSKPETLGVDVPPAFELARAAEACITLSSTNLEFFQANLPSEAPDYHSFDDLTELIWRNWLQNPDIKPAAKEYPQTARAKSIEIWKILIWHSAPELRQKLHFNYYDPITKREGIKSALRRTLISDPAIYDFYNNTKHGVLPGGIGHAAVHSIQMLLAGTHPDLIEANWPPEVLEFMGETL